MLTDWPEFRALDWTAMARLAAAVVVVVVVVDTRNLLDPHALRRAGYRWIGVGRG